MRYVHSHYPEPGTCPKCLKMQMTRVDHMIGGYTWLMVAILFCFTGICCFIPLLFAECKDAYHYCGNCGHLIGVKRPGESRQHYGYGRYDSDYYFWLRFIYTYNGKRNQLNLKINNFLSWSNPIPQIFKFMYFSKFNHW